MKAAKKASEGYQEGQGYVMRGYSLQGQFPLYRINITKDTLFFKSGQLEVSEAPQLDGIVEYNSSVNFHLEEILRDTGA